MPNLHLQYVDFILSVEIVVDGTMIRKGRLPIRLVNKIVVRAVCEAGTAEWTRSAIVVSLFTWNFRELTVRTKSSRVETFAFAVDTFSIARRWVAIGAP